MHLKRIERFHSLSLLQHYNTEQWLGFLASQIRFTGCHGSRAAPGDASVPGRSAHRSARRKVRVLTALITKQLSDPSIGLEFEVLVCHCNVCIVCFAVLAIRYGTIAQILYTFLSEFFLPVT